MDSSSSVTVTQREQMMVEQGVFQIYRLFADMPPTSQSFMLELQRDSHIEYLANGLRELGSSFCVLDAMFLSRPWLCYWILHSLALLEESIDDELENITQLTFSVVDRTQTGDMVVVRDGLYSFLRQMKQPNGGFSFGARKLRARSPFESQQATGRRGTTDPQRAKEQA